MNDRLAKRWELDNGLCVKCTGPGKIIHHVKYARHGGRENLSDLRTVCEVCNRMVTAYSKGMGDTEAASWEYFNHDIPIPATLRVVGTATSSSGKGDRLIYWYHDSVHGCGSLNPSVGENGTPPEKLTGTFLPLITEKDWRQGHRGNDIHVIDLYILLAGIIRDKYGGYGFLHESSGWTSGRLSPERDSPLQVGYLPDMSRSQVSTMARFLKTSGSNNSQPPLFENF